MRQVSKWFEVKTSTGSTVIEALEGGHNYGSKAVVVTSLQGWEETPEKEIESAPSLYGNGSYISNIRIPSREVEIGITIYGQQAKNIIRGIEAEYARTRELTFSRYYSTTTKSNYSRKETMKGYITEISEVNQVNDTLATITFKAFFANPIKSVD